MANNDEFKSPSKVQLYDLLVPPLRVRVRVSDFTISLSISEMGGPNMMMSVSSLREQSAMLTLRKARKDGHVYVQLRQDGRKFIFFCVLCHARCYSDTALFQHLTGNHHRERYASARLTLLMANPWPFNDGVFFFYEPPSDVSDTVSEELVVPGVLRKDQMCCLRVKFVGFGEIGARILEYDENREEMNRIWCSWLGEKRSCDQDDVARLPDHDFGVVTFQYDYNLGRKPVVSDFDQVSSSFRVANVEGQSKKSGGKSLSDPEDFSQCLAEQGGSCVKDYPTSDLASLHQLQHSKSTLRRIRRELRQQQRIAAERTCDICQDKLLPGYDVSCLMNVKTGRLACSSRNHTGAFHLCHVSCLLHWILLCEYEIWTNRSSTLQSPPHPPPRKKCRTKQRAKQMGERKHILRPISTVFCPDCQGTGIHVEDQLERPSFPLSEMFNYKAKLKEAQKAWFKTPQILQNCSLGLQFPRQSDEAFQEITLRRKSLRFYRADV